MELIDLVNPCYNFSISVDLTQMVKFPTWISNCDFHRPVLLDFVISFNSCISSVTKLVKFCKKWIFLSPWNVRIRGQEMLVFRKIWRALFSWNTSFEICSFAFYRRFVPLTLFQYWEPWSCCSLSFLWISVKLKRVCLFPLQNLSLFSCWLGRSSWPHERCSMKVYL